MGGYISFLICSFLSVFDGRSCGDSDNPPPTPSPPSPPLPPGGCPIGTNPSICKINIDGTKEYLLYKDEGGKCKTTCEKEEDIAKKLAEGYVCNEICNVECPLKELNICEQKDGKTKYWLFRNTIGQCDVECKEEKVRRLLSTIGTVP